MKCKQTILIVNPADKLRKETRLLIKGLPKQGFKVLLLASESSLDIANVPDNIEVISYSDYYIPKIRYSIPTFSYLVGLARGISRSDIVQICSYIYLTSFFASLLATIFRKKAVITVDALPGVSWSYDSKYIDSIAYIYTIIIGRLIFRQTDIVVALGKYLKDDLSRYAPKSDVKIIPNGVNINKYSPVQKGMRDCFEILYVGRLDSVKNVNILLQAFSQLQGSHANKEYHLTIVGNGSEYQRLIDLAKDLNIFDEIAFEGWQKEVATYYQSSDIFVLPSKSEGLPTVLMEAHACGIPIVTTPVGGVDEIVVAGRLLNSSDPGEISFAVREIASKYQRGYSEEARKHIVENFSEQNSINKYSKLYEKLFF